MMGLLKTALTIAAIFAAIVSAFDLTRPAPQEGAALVALTEPTTGELPKQVARKPDVHPSPAVIAAGLL